MKDSTITLLLGCALMAAIYGAYYSGGKDEYKRGLADARKAQLSQEERKRIEEQHKDDLAWRKAHPRTVTVWGDEYIPRFSASWDGETVKCEVVKE